MTGFDELAPLLRHVAAAWDALAEAEQSTPMRRTRGTSLVLPATAAVPADQPGAPSDVVALADAVSQARGAVYQALLAQGWQPPPDVLATLRVDRRLRAEGLGAGFDDPDDAGAGGTARVGPAPGVGAGPTP